MPTIPLITPLSLSRFSVIINFMFLKMGCGWSRLDAKTALSIGGLLPNMYSMSSQLMLCEDVREYVRKVVLGCVL